jgi:hypothetical protein
MLKWMPVPVLIGSLQNIYMERWFELFVGKFNMDVDVIDASPQMLEFHRENFQDHSEVILSNQTVNLANWPLRQRFRIAMKLVFWSPHDFQRIVGLPTTSQLGQLYDEHRGTALHWAAKEWCIDLSFSVPGGHEKIPHPEDYQDNRLKEFILALLENKASLRALDKQGITPLTCMLDCSYYYRRDAELWETMDFIHGCAVPAALWGRLLSGVDISLLEYVAEENATLIARSDCGWGEICLAERVRGSVRLRRFVLSNRQELLLEGTTVIILDIWVFRPPPGLFLDLREDCSTIFWPPGRDDGDRTCWQKTGSRELRSRPFIWTRSHELDDDVETDEECSFDALFDSKTHDHHSALALLVGRDRRRRARENQTPFVFHASSPRERL